MPTEPTIWQLCTERCICCNKQNELVFAICPTCSLVVLCCSDVGTVFEIRDQHTGSVLGGSPSAVCAKCGKNAYAEFRDASLDEILALGFQPRDIKRWEIALSDDDHVA